MYPETRRKGSVEGCDNGDSDFRSCPACREIPVRMFGISLQRFKLEMLRGAPTKVQDESQHEDDFEDRILAPLAMPMIAGPGAIATVITLSAKARFG